MDISNCQHSSVNTSKAPEKTLSYHCNLSYTWLIPPAIVFSFPLETIHTSSTLVKMKVVGSTCALKSKIGGEEMVRCLSDQSLAITKCKIPLLDEQMTVFLQDMNSCYSKLKELVPTLPTNKKASKVEILQHVIDYIWDLQVELDEPEKSRQASLPRTPLTTLNAELASISVEVNIATNVIS